MIWTAWQDFLSTVNRAGFAWKNLLGQQPERGEWTPALTFSTTGGLVLTYQRQKGYWERVGKLTHASAYLHTSTFSLSGVAGVAKITGFPFKADDLSDYFPLGQCVWEGISSAGYTQIVSFMREDDNMIYMDAQGAGKAHQNVSAGYFSNGANPQILVTILFTAKE